MVANVKQMKLITGEEILCDLTEALYDEEDGIEHTLLLRSAYTLVSHEDFENQVRYYTFKPFMMHLYEPNKVLALNAHSVICMVQPDKKVIDQYDEHISQFNFDESAEEDEDPLAVPEDDEPTDDKVLKFKPKNKLH